MNAMIEKLPKPVVLSLAAGIGCFIAAIFAELFLFLTNPPSPKQNICVTIDVSGSMAGNKLDDVKRAAQAFVENCDMDRNSIAVTIFSSAGNILVPMTSDKSELVRQIGQIISYGGTNFEEALLKSKEAILPGNSNELVADRNRGDKRTLLLFTDGANSEGNPSNAVTTAGQLRSDGVNVLAIATDDADFPYLTSLTGDSANVIPVKGGNIQNAFKEAESRIFGSLMQSGGTAGGNPLFALFQVCVWSTILCFGIAVGLVGMQNKLLKKRALTALILLGLIVGAAVAGGIAGGCGQILYSLFSLISTGFVVEFGRIIAWAALGAIMALIMVRFIPNLSRRWAWRGGTLGGVLGAIGFLMVNSQLKGLGGFGDVGGRLTGAFILGACIGFIVGVVEKVCREAWLTVVYSPKRFTQVNIGGKAITVGSGAGDTIQTTDVPENAASFKIENGIIRCTEGGRTFDVQPGEKRRVGKIDLVVCTPDRPYQGGPQLSGGTGGSPSPRPSGPSRPSAPSSPTPSPRPSGPSGPTVPSSPIASPRSSGPSRPTAPSSPTPSPRPSGPSSPAGPSGPSGPSLPSGPSTGSGGKKPIPLPPRKKD